MFLLFASSAPAQNNLEQSFQNPPSEARPRVWWHWMNGNITKEGIRKDFEWMERTGIGGFQNFDAALSTPQVVKDRLIYMTPEWKDAFKYTTELAASKGLEMAIAGSPGWSESGGPWVSPEQAMKKLVWSELDIPGGKRFKGTLPHPPTATGSFQNIEMALRSAFSQSTQTELPHYYKDIAVIAVRMPEEYKPMKALKPSITSSAGSFSLDRLTDGDLVAADQLPYGEPGSASWIQYAFDAPVTVYAIDVVGSAGGGGFRRGPQGPLPVLECSMDGQAWQKVTEIGGAAAGMSALSFPAVTARYFRLVYTAPRPQQADPRMAQMFGGMGGPQQAAPTGVPVAEFRLYTTPKVHRFVEKAGFAAASDLNEAPTPCGGSAIAKADVIDVTKYVKNGVLTWTPKAGTWKILRFGCTLTGHQNSPASPEATGLEVDKLSVEHVRAYFEHYLDMYKDATGGQMGPGGLQYVITDSWEAGCLNWTDKMFENFASMRQYDLHQWLPALAGYVVDSPENSDKFLWDWRRTLGELTARNHYDLLTAILAERGMGRYTESHENGRAFVGDGMEVKKNAAVPMSAMWTTGLGQSGADIRESSSVAHIYGQKYVAAESLTAGGNAWSYVPETLKPTADWEMANGLNRFVIHTSVHQPLDDFKPGFSLGPFGQWFTRHETWAENAAKPWITYLARSCYLLQQGEYKADILYFYGEGSNITAQYGNALPAIPAGYNFDFINADAILNVLSCEDGKLAVPAGTRYSFIYLDPDYAKYISVPVLRKLETLVEEGALLVGLKPLSSPSLQDDPAEFKALATRLWGDGFGLRKIGKGQVFSGASLEQAVLQLGICPDIRFAGQYADSDVKYVHRSVGDTQIYWLDSRSGKAENILVSLNVTGYEPEVWNAVTGTISKPSYRMEGGRTLIPLRFEPWDALFVVFRNKTARSAYEAPACKVERVTTVEGSWDVAFPGGMGAPSKTTFATLSDWAVNADQGIKYYSGTAIYTKSVDMDASRLGGKVWLDLGDVQNIAQVKVNGKDCGLVWKTPFRFDITDAVKAGANQIEVQITNMWVNRLIGDVQPGATPYARTSQQSYQPNAPLKPSGLIGPVRIESEK